MPNNNTPFTGDWQQIVRQVTKSGGTIDLVGTHEIWFEFAGYSAVAKPVADTAGNWQITTWDLDEKVCNYTDLAQFCVDAEEGAIEHKYC